MLRTTDDTDSQTSYAWTVNPGYDTSHEPVSPVAPTQETDGCDLQKPTLTDVDELLQIELWKPGEPQYCKAVADHYGVSRRTVQKWFQRLLKLCPWFTESDLHLSDDRYTPLAVELMGECYLSGSAKLWAEQVAERFVSYLAPCPDSSSAPTSNPAMVPYQPESEEIDRFTPPDRKVFKFTSTDKFTAIAKQNTETTLDVTQNNSSSLTEALVSQMQQEGQKLGLTLFQAKYGTAHTVLAELEQSLAKKSGLAEEVRTPPAR